MNYLNKLNLFSNRNRLWATIMEWNLNIEFFAACKIRKEREAGFIVTSPLIICLHDSWS